MLSFLEIFKKIGNVKVHLQGQFEIDFGNLEKILLFQISHVKPLMWLLFNLLVSFLHFSSYRTQLFKLWHIYCFVTNSFTVRLFWEITQELTFSKFKLHIRSCQ